VRPVNHDIRSLYADNVATGSPMAMLTAPERRPEYDFNQGVPAPETFPLEEMTRLAHEVVDEDGTVAFEYRDPGAEFCGFREMTLGPTGLRDQIARRLNQRNDLSLDRNNIILTHGSVQAIGLAVAAFINPGDGAIVESSTFPWMVRALRNAGAKIAHAPMDGEGVIPDGVEQCLKTFDAQGTRPKMIYLGVDFQTPTGTVMPVTRRRHLLEIARRWNIVVVEDAIYNDLRYDGEQLPTLQSLDTDGRVLQTNSFSKSLMCGLRMGWASGDIALVEGLATARNDLGVSQWTARILERWLADDRLEPHLKTVTSLYRRRRDLADAALSEHCSHFLTYQKPPGGYYFWLRMNREIDWQVARSTALAKGIYIRSGELMALDGTGTEYMRMAFAHVNDDVLTRGIAVLGEALAESARS
jgi:2-aminoadipate transaminase